MKFNIGKSLLIIPISIILTSVQVFGSSNFQDILDTHPAYEAISAMSDKGYIVGDASGNFKPDANIDKFELVKILARVLGYKYTNASEEDINYYNFSYEKNKDLILEYENTFSYWKNTTNKEIAFLLEKGVLSKEDLNQFVVLDSNQNERYRALSNEEAAIFLVRVINKQAEAGSFTTDFKFTDDDKIQLNNKQYVYFLHNNKVVASDEMGNFNPNKAVTKATFSIMLYNALNVSENSVNSNNSTQNSSNEVYSVSGKIEKVYDSLNVIQIKNSENKSEMFKVNNDAVIVIDSLTKKFDDLKIGMDIKGVIDNGFLININTTSINNTPVIQDQDQNNTSNNTNTVNNQNNNTTTSFFTDAVLEGVIKNVINNEIILEIKTLSQLGEINIMSNAFYIPNSASIVRGGEAVSFDNIEIGDIARITIHNSNIELLSLQDITKDIKEGILIEKRLSNIDSTPILVIEDTKGTIFEFKVDTSSYLYREGLGATTWNNLRKGDIVDLSSENGVINEISAYGVLSTVDVTVEEISIGRNDVTLKVIDIDGKIGTYELPVSYVDVYSIRVGSNLRLKLDSQEIQTVALLEDNIGSSFTGEIGSISNNRITLRATNTKETVNVDIDSSTIIIDSKTGNIVTQNYLSNNSTVYVVYSSSTSQLARTITILY